MPPKRCAASCLFLYSLQILAVLDPPRILKTLYLVNKLTDRWNTYLGVVIKVFDMIHGDGINIDCLLLRFETATESRHLVLTKISS